MRWRKLDAETIYRDLPVEGAAYVTWEADESWDREPDEYPYYVYLAGGRGDMVWDHEVDCFETLREAMRAANRVVEREEAAADDVEKLLEKYFEEPS